MAIEETTDLVPTILDRLAPQEENRGELGSRRHSGAVEASIARDLEMLLNTRREEFLVPPEFEQTATSIVNFGVPDLTKCGSLRTGPEQAKLCRWIEEAIRNFEPRLRNVAVRVIDRENVTPMLRFRVEAKAEFASERIAFDLGLKRDSGELAILQR
ncbi:MAG: type VI secretion system baseplate subunit TssE [Acidobacteriia bacterium]|nr:type VI secretion system baseplate subunit TssE [Terriglobia bacterium]